MDTNLSDVNTSVIMAMTTTNGTIEQHFGFLFYIFVVQCCLSPFILLDNGLTVVIVTRHIRTVVPKHVTVTYLAGADFTVGMTPWFHLATFMAQGDWKYWKNLCTFVAWFDYVSVARNNVAVLFFAVERCFHVTKLDLFQKKYTVTKQKIISGVSAFFIVSGVIVDMAVSKVNRELGKCYFDLHINYESFYIIVFLIYGTILLVLTFSYVKIIYFLWRKRSAVRGAISGSQNMSDKEKKTTVLVALIVNFYIFTSVSMWIHVQTKPNEVTMHSVHVYDIILFIYYWNAIGNPTLYTARIRVSKEAYNKIFSRICKLGRSQLLF